MGFDEVRQVESKKEMTDGYHNIDGKKIYIETYGCQMNVADSEVVASVMEMDGFGVTFSAEEGDGIFIIS